MKTLKQNYTENLRAAARMAKSSGKPLHVWPQDFLNAEEFFESLPYVGWKTPPDFQEIGALALPSKGGRNSLEEGHAYGICETVHGKYIGVFKKKK